jgi:hypothetical protein
MTTNMIPLDINQAKFVKQNQESDQEYINRICAAKDYYRWTWEDVRDIINSELGLNYSESKYRKNYAKQLIDSIEEDFCENNNDEEIKTLESVILEYKKERAKLSDERVQNNAYIRRLAREDSLKEIAFDAASKMNNFMPLPSVNLNIPCKRDREGILCLSDWHYGIEINNYFNKYNPEIAKERVAKLRDEVINLGKFHGISKLHVVDLADLIAGRIRLTIRLESRIDVITQTIEVSEILAELLNDLSNYFEIEYYSCLDNHSRLEPNIKDSLDLESLVRIIPWYLETRLGNKIHINKNKYADDIINFEVLGYKYLAVHGHKDKQNTIINNLTMMTKQHSDVILGAHNHHFSCEEKNDIVLISNGSLMGTDSYAEKLRLNSKPSQNLIIVSEDNPAKAIHRILVS